MRTIYGRKERNLIFTCLLVVLSLVGTTCMSVGASLEYRTPWKFAVISDTQGDNRSESCINDGVIRAIAEDIVREKPDFVLVAGDLVKGWFRNGGIDYATQYRSWKETMKPVYRSGIQVYPIRGNHDDGPERLALPPLPSHLEPPPATPILLKNAFKNVFIEHYIPTNGPVGEERLTYSFTHKNAYIVALDQYTGGQHRVNQVWLDRQLTENENLHVFVFGHEPAFEVNHNDNLAFFPKERDIFWDSIGKAGARIYFCGHDHFYNRAMIPDSAGNQIRQIIAGTGGGKLRTWSGIYGDNERVEGEYSNCDHHGYILVAVEGQKVTVLWKALMEQGMDAWQLLDTFTYSVPTQ